jgi:hypothetical protein
MTTLQRSEGAERPGRAAQISGLVATGLFATVMVASGVLYLVGPAPIAAEFHHLGYPDYFRHLLGVAKLLGAIALVAPPRWPTLREWAYAGFAFDMIAAVASHAASGEPVGVAIPPLFALGLLAVSYLTRRSARLAAA